MKRKISAAIAAILAGSMIIGSTVFAAPSSTTDNTDSTAVTESSSSQETTVVAPLEEEAVKEGKTMFAVPNAKGEGTATVGTTRVTVNYSQCTVANAIETIVLAPANEESTKVLEQYAASTFPGKKILVRAKARLYKAGVSINEFGTIQQSYGVGNQYDGQTATVVQIHKDGTITTTEVPVVNGKVSFSTTDLGTFFILL